MILKQIGGDSKNSGDDLPWPLGCFCKYINI